MEKGILESLEYTGSGYVGKILPDGESAQEWGEAIVNMDENGFKRFSGGREVDMGLPVEFILSESNGRFFASRLRIR